MKIVPKRDPKSPQSDPGRAPRADISQICIPGCAGLRPETPPSQPERAGCSGLRPQQVLWGLPPAHPPPSTRSYLPTTTFLLLTTFPSSDPHAGPRGSADSTALRPLPPTPRSIYGECYEVGVHFISNFAMLPNICVSASSCLPFPIGA